MARSRRACTQHVISEYQFTRVPPWGFNNYCITCVCLLVSAFADISLSFFLSFWLPTKLKRLANERLTTFSILSNANAKNFKKINEGFHCKMDGSLPPFCFSKHWAMICKQNTCYLPKKSCTPVARVTVILILLTPYQEMQPQTVDTSQWKWVFIWTD